MPSVAVTMYATDSASSSARSRLEDRVGQLVGERLDLLPRIVANLNADMAFVVAAIAVDAALEEVLLYGEAERCGDAEELVVETGGVVTFQLADRHGGQLLAVGLGKVEDVGDAECARCVDDDRPIASLLDAYAASQIAA